MRAFRGCSALVIRCFKKVETFADWLTGAAGPVFVFFCWSLIGLGGVAFFDTIVRDLTWLSTILLSPILLLVPVNLYGQYYLVCSVPPGYPSPRALAKNPNGPMSTEREIRWLTHDAKSPQWPEYWGWRRPSTAVQEMRAPLTGEAVNAGSAGKRRVRRCRKCDGPKPERTHHCSVCKRCVLLMDHHCPWINGCVGIHNQRHFVLFMAWLSLACWFVFALGWDRAWRSIDFRQQNWSGYTPRIAFTLLYVLSIAIGVAVPVLGGWHVYLASRGETSIESHDNSYLEGKAKSEGLIYLNPYDLGRKRNLQLFFNVGPGGYPVATLLLPLLVPPYTNGWTYPRRPLPHDHDDHAHGREARGKLHAPELADGLISSENGRAPPFRHGDGAGEGGGRGKYVMGDQEGLTDDEEGGGGWMDYDY